MRIENNSMLSVSVPLRGVVCSLSVSPTLLHVASITGLTQLLLLLTIMTCVLKPMRDQVYKDNNCTGICHQL